MPETVIPPSPDALLRTLRRLLRPLVRLLIRSGVTFPLLAEMIRGLYVDVASLDLLDDPQARTDSRISLLTGVHRKELRRLRELGNDDAPPPTAVTLSTQLIARWLAAPPWITEAGQPRRLPRSGPASFDSLVESVTKDVRARTVFEEWHSQGVVGVDDQDRIVLNAAAYLPRAGGEEQLYFFARNLADHIAAASANVLAGASPRFFDRSVHYDELDIETADRLEAQAREAGQAWLVAVNSAAMRLTEAASTVMPATRRVNFGVYVYAEDQQPAGKA